MNDRSPNLTSYAETLQRLRAAEGLDERASATRSTQFRASLVHRPLRETDNLAVAFAYHRHRTGS